MTEEQEREEFLAELRSSRTILCRRAATSLSVAWAANESQKLKKTQEELGSALACSFKKNGEMLIFVTANADNDEVMASLVRLSMDLSKYRGAQL